VVDVYAAPVDDPIGFAMNPTGSTLDGSVDL